MPNDITEGKAAQHVKHSESVADFDLNKFVDAFNSVKVVNGSVVIIGDVRPQDFLVIHELGLVLADLGKLGVDGLCYCEAQMPVEPSKPHAHRPPAFGGDLSLCVYCDKWKDDALHTAPYQRRHSDKCLRARKALDEFGEWLKTEKAGKAAPVAPEGVNAQESASEELRDVLLRELRADK